MRKVFTYLSRLWAFPLLISICVAPLAMAGNNSIVCLVALKNPFIRPIQQLPAATFAQNRINLTHIIPPPGFRVHLTMLDSSGVSLFRTPRWAPMTGGVSCERIARGGAFSIHGNSTLNGF